NDGTLNHLNGPTTLHSGGYLYDFVVFNDSVNTVGQTHTLTANTLTRSTIAPIMWDTMNQVILYTGSGQGQAGKSQVNVQAVAAESCGRAAVGTAATVPVGSLAPGLGGTLANILGPFRVLSYQGQTPSVVIDD